MPNTGDGVSPSRVVPVPDYWDTYERGRALPALFRGNAVEYI